MVSFNSLKMVCQGYKKVPLKDTKGVLTKANNFKWVKNTKDATKTVLSTGTKISEYSSGSKYIEKANSIKVLIRNGSLRGEYNICLANKTDIEGFYDLKKYLKVRTKADILKEKAEKAMAALNKKRQAFIENFNKKYERTFIKGDDGSMTKLTHDKKTGKLVRWFRKDGKTGKFSIGNIYNYPGGLGKEMCVETPDKFIYKNVVDCKDLFGKKLVDKVDIPKKRNN